MIIPKGSSIIGKKPGHKKSERGDEGLYDELYYDLAPRAHGVINQLGNINDENPTSKPVKTDTGSTPKELIINNNIIDTNHQSRKKNLN